VTEPTDSVKRQGKIKEALKGTSNGRQDSRGPVNVSAGKIRELDCWRKSFEIIWDTEWVVVLCELRVLDVFERSYVPVQLLLFDI